MSTPLTDFVGSKPSGSGSGSGSGPEPEAARSSLPGLRSAASRDRGAPAGASDGKWDPWRSVSATSKTAATRQDAPESSLQSAVFAKDGGAAAGSIADFMSDITYPPLQQPAGSGTPKATS
ncbi:hypothetical protein IWQ57_001107 [Coemansia nantahalensis]|uniref:Uncharacterized protein n=1 Tax=Coemansia nantahalensis TaxID=2789366 RepID=A0ACC1K584_9FUNG|nr:hypothetical protein IWQ57_001107 [Coemansia nantahalensis]